MTRRMPRACIVGFRCSDGGIAVAGTSRCSAHTAPSGWGRYMAEHPERAGGDLDATNLQSLCRKHHHEKTVEEGHRGMQRKGRRRSVIRREEN